MGESTDNFAGVASVERRLRMGGNPGSREPSQSALSRPDGFDPGRVERLVRQVTLQDPYLADYLLGWFGLANPQPWGAAMSFALEVAYGYGFIKGESDATATPLGLAVADRLKAIAGEARSGETVQQGSTGTASTRAEGIAHTSPPSSGAQS